MLQEKLWKHLFLTTFGDDISLINQTLRRNWKLYFRDSRNWHGKIYNDRYMILRCALSGRLCCTAEVLLSLFRRHAVDQCQLQGMRFGRRKVIYFNHLRPPYKNESETHQRSSDHLNNTGGGVFLEGNHSLWQVVAKLMSKFSNLACSSIASAAHSSAFVDGAMSNSVGTKPLAVDHPLVATFLQKLCRFLPAMLCFLAPNPQTDD